MKDMSPIKNVFDIKVKDNTMPNLSEIPVTEPWALRSLGWF